MRNRLNTLTQGEESQVVVAEAAELKQEQDQVPIVRRQVHDYNYFSRVNECAKSEVKWWM